jgi:hypothetical protein
MLGCILACSLALPVAASASSGQWMSFEAPSELLDDSRRDATLDEIRAFGVDRVRALVYWRDHAPSPNSKQRPSFDAANPDAYPAGTWDRLDRLFAAAGARGITVSLTLTGPVPKWATKRKRDQITRPSASQFRAFATAVGRRFGDRVSMWSVWNEPNHPAFLKPQYVKRSAKSPRIYRSLFYAARAGLTASGNAGDQVLMGETAPRGTSRVVAPLKFLRGALCLSSRYRKQPNCGRVPADGWAHHAYTTKVGPWFKPGPRDDVTIGVLGRMTGALAKAERAKALPKGTGLYLTEFGVQSKPDPFIGVSLAKQAEYIAIAERIAHRTSRVKSFSQYLMQDDQPRSGPRISRYSGFESGLRKSNGAKKPAYSAFRLPLAVKRRSAWGRVRPAGGATSVELLGKRGKRWSVLKTVRTGARATFQTKVPKRTRYRLRWTAPDGSVHLGAVVRSYTRG